MAPDLNDDRLMELSAAGDQEAFGLLVARWETQVRTFLWRMTGSTEDARDLCQETFIKVFSEAGRYRRGGRFKSWLFRIAGNAARSHLRRARILSWVRFDVRAHDRPAAGGNPERQMERDRTREAVRRAIMELPVRQREAILLSRFHEMSQRDIAAAMKTTEAAVESLLRRAGESLRRKLAGEVIPS